LLFFFLSFLGGTPLHNAAYNGHYESAFVLLRNGAAVDDVDLRGCTALHLATSVRGRDRIREIRREEKRKEKKERRKESVFVLSRNGAAVGEVDHRDCIWLLWCVNRRGKKREEN
jgi:Ankyrin repeats (many copies)